VAAEYNEPPRRDKHPRTLAVPSLEQIGLHSRQFLLPTPREEAEGTRLPRRSLDEVSLKQAVQVLSPDVDGVDNPSFCDFLSNSLGLYVSFRHWADVGSEATYRVLRNLHESFRKVFITRQHKPRPI